MSLLLGSTLADVCTVLDATKDDIYPDINDPALSTGHIMQEEKATEDEVFSVTQVTVTSLQNTQFSSLHGASLKLKFKLTGSGGTQKTWEFED